MRHRLLLSMFALAAAQAASAHLMPAGQGAVRLVDDSAYAVISVPVAALAGFDDNRDGLIDVAEINAHRAQLNAQVSRVLQLRDGGDEGRLLFEDLLLSHADTPEFKGADHVVVMRRYQWDHPVRAVALRFEGEGKIVVRGIRGDESEAAILSRDRPGHTFFAASWRAFANFGAFAAAVLAAAGLLYLVRRWRAQANTPAVSCMRAETSPR